MKFLVVVIILSPISFVRGKYGKRYIYYEMSMLIESFTSIFSELSMKGSLYTEMTRAIGGSYCCVLQCVAV